MADQKQTELAAAKTQELPAVRPAIAPPGIVPTTREDDRFRAEQERIKEMIAADAPLSEILSNLVLKPLTRTGVPTGSFHGARVGDIWTGLKNR